MRVLLVGRPIDRDRLRPQLLAAGFDVVAESIELPAESARPSHVQAIVMAPSSGSLATGARTSPEPMAEALTARELEVLAHLAEGLPNKAIAAALGISDQTVKFHVAAIIAKLGASNRTEAVRRAVRRGLVVV
jgi:DNA-binding NarL/FixJ family response regulator